MAIDIRMRRERQALRGEITVEDRDGIVMLPAAFDAEDIDDEMIVLGRIDQQNFFPLL